MAHRSQSSKRQSYKEWISPTVSVLALFVSAISAYFAYQANEETKRQNELSRAYSFTTTAERDFGKPIALVSDALTTGDSFDYMYDDPDDGLKPTGIVGLWLRLAVANQGFRTFSITEIRSIVTRSQSAMLNGHIEMIYELTDNTGKPSQLPVPVEPGKQVVLLAKMPWPVTLPVVRALNEDLMGKGSSCDDLYANSLEKHGLSLSGKGALSARDACAQTSVLLEPDWPGIGIQVFTTIGSDSRPFYVPIR